VRHWLVDMARRRTFVRYDGAVSILTLTLQAGPALISDRAAMPKSLQRAQRFTATALMGALASRSVTRQVTAASGGAAVLVAAAVAVPIALRTRSMTWTMAGGAAAYVLATAAIH